jgi:hypothetical protein
VTVTPTHEHTETDDNADVLLPSVVMTLPKYGGLLDGDIIVFWICAYALGNTTTNLASEGGLAFTNEPADVSKVLFCYDEGVLLGDSWTQEDAMWLGQVDDASLHPANYLITFGGFFGGGSALTLDWVAGYSLYRGTGAYELTVYPNHCFTADNNISPYPTAPVITGDLLVEVRQSDIDVASPGGLYTTRWNIHQPTAKAALVDSLPDLTGAVDLVWTDHSNRDSAGTVHISQPSPAEEGNETESSVSVTPDTPIRANIPPTTLPGDLICVGVAWRNQPGSNPAAYAGRVGPWPRWGLWHKPPNAAALGSEIIFDSSGRPYYRLSAGFHPQSLGDEGPNCAIYYRRATGGEETATVPIVFNAQFAGNDDSFALEPANALAVVGISVLSGVTWTPNNDLSVGYLNSVNTGDFITDPGPLTLLVPTDARPCIAISMFAFQGIWDAEPASSAGWELAWYGQTDTEAELALAAAFFTNTLAAGVDVDRQDITDEAISDFQGRWVVIGGEAMNLARRVPSLNYGVLPGHLAGVSVAGIGDDFVTRPPAPEKWFTWPPPPLDPTPRPPTPPWGQRRDPRRT